MKTKLIFKCARCGTEYEDTTRRFSLGRYKWHTIRYSQYSEFGFGCKEEDPMDLCDTCYDALKAFMKMDDGAEFYNNEIKERDATIKTLKNELSRVREYGSTVTMDYKKLQNEFNNCKSFCPRSCPDWEEYCKWHNEKERNEIGLTDKGVIY